MCAATSPRTIAQKLQLTLGGQLDGEAAQGARERVAQRAADEQRVDDLDAGIAALELVAQLERDVHALLPGGGEAHRLRAGQALVLDLDVLAVARRVAGDTLQHATAPARLGVPEHR